MSKESFIGQYKGMEVMPEPPEYLGFDKPCHVCDQYGAFYTVRFPRLQSQCGHCWGYGWIHPTNTCKGHEWKHIEAVGRCLTLWKCEHCDAEREVDSSD